MTEDHEHTHTGEEEHRHVTKEIHKDTSKNPFIQIWHFAMNHFFVTFITLYLITMVLLLMNRGMLSIASGVILLVYIIFYNGHRIHKTIHQFIYHELSLQQITVGYITSVLFMIILFSLVYWVVTTAGVGYLRYGSCIDTTEVTKNMIIQDDQLVTRDFHYTYFSAITFFTVGYGDICPMGAAKFIAVLNALVGSIFNVLILAVAIMNYSAYKSHHK